MKWILRIISPFCFSVGLYAQHNSDYMQYMFNGLLINPAYAGSREALDLTALYRKQWMGFNGSPVTASFGAHSPLSNKKVNVGLLLLNDCYGITSHTQFAAAYAYRFRFLNGNLSLGLQGGFNSYKSNWNKINTTDQNDPNFNIGNDKAIYASAGFGIYYYSKKMYFGFSTPELLQQGVNKYTTAITNAGLLLDAGSNIKIKPAVLVKYITASPVYVNMSSTFYWKDIIGIGVGYTNKTSVMAILDLKINDQFRVGYGYDRLINELKIYSTASHEVMLRYLFRYKVETVSTRYF